MREATRDQQFEDILVALIAFMQERRLEAHTTRGQTLILKPRQEKRRRNINGRPKSDA